jgi:hypothetical protein
MGKDDWKDKLRGAFESIDILEKCKVETAENFKQFCEFIAEPAFEALAEELKEYGIRAKYWILKGRSVCLRFHFQRSRVDNFQYMISLPRNSVEMRLLLQVRGRTMPKSPLKEKELSFMEKIPPDRVMKISKEDLIEDVIEQYKNFILEALASAD